MSAVLSVLLAGGCGSRLRPLTLHQAKPAVPFAGRFRIIDFVLSNLLHSGFTDLLVLTQYQAAGLEHYLQQHWGGRFRRQGFLRCYHAEANANLGTAGAVAIQLSQIRNLQPQHIALLSADHIYKMDYRQMLRYHLQQQAAVTVAAIAIPKAHAHRFGIIQTDATGRITGFIEKPQTPPPCMPGRPGYVLASMGNYLFNAATLYQSLALCQPGHYLDFGQQVLPALFKQHAVYVYNFADNLLPGTQALTGYWRDVGTLNAFYAAQQDVLNHPDWLQGPTQPWPILNGSAIATQIPRHQLRKVQPMTGGRPCYAMHQYGLQQQVH
ncbi:glucose-1-phosphate adenylyltransferase [Arsukibacterium tuosuense]|uniref:Glucose-1-phosphate adenylyltransferase n=1 Tax=Arsukibacterium tuosuense TaxID=1323745 RepID=A0A285JBI9_9GAMM|nr:sugar phosphate nucleotidyltransferase [Arsukibacterium tuosuense]SNY57612.1 glucose-1-phosphate adenylyltransferase [Arsukibacterium tuosuense]